MVSLQRARSVWLGADTAFCSGQSLVLDAGSGYLRYQWNTGADTRQLEVKNAGLYTLLATDQNGCITRDSLRILQVFALPRVQLARDQPLCEGSYVNLVAPAGMRTYLWSDGSTEPSMDASALGSYWVRVTDQNGCEASDTSTITLLVPIVQNILPKDQAVCSYSQFTITPTRRFDQYLWSTNETRSSIVVNKPGTYWLRAVDGYGCTARDSIVITHTECAKGFYAPNVFTPNADGINDIFKPSVFGPLLKYELHVFNRFGEKIFQSTDPNQGWNGNIKGQQIPTGTFTWYCIYQLQGEDVKKEKGTVTLIR
jgi:gliding motility-associated-like protein